MKHEESTTVFLKKRWISQYLGRTDIHACVYKSTTAAQLAHYHYKLMRIEENKRRREDPKASGWHVNCPPEEERQQSEQPVSYVSHSSTFSLNKSPNWVMKQLCHWQFHLEVWWRWEDLLWSDSTFSFQLVRYRRRFVTPLRFSKSSTRYPLGPIQTKSDIAVISAGLCGGVRGHNWSLSPSAPSLQSVSPPLMVQRPDSTMLFQAPSNVTETQSKLTHLWMFVNVSTWQYLFHPELNMTTWKTPIKRIKRKNC